MFLESVEHREWDKIVSQIRFKLFDFLPPPVYICLFWANPGFIQLSWTILGYLRLSLAISGCLRLSWTISGHLGPYLYQVSSIRLQVGAGEIISLLLETFSLFLLCFFTLAISRGARTSKHLRKKG